MCERAHQVHMMKLSLGYTHLLVASLSLAACAGETLEGTTNDDDSSVSLDSEQTGEGDPEVLAQQNPLDGVRKAIEDAVKAWEAARAGRAPSIPGTPAPTNPTTPPAPTTPAEPGEAPVAGPTETPGGDGPVAAPGAIQGRGGVVNATIVVKGGTTFDGKGLRYTAGSALGNGSQDEGQKPVFKLENGARIVNVRLGAPAADGIHTYGNVTLENIVWEDIGEDAMTIKESGTVVLKGGSAKNGDDKVFQINAASTFRVSNFTADKAGKFIRQNGDTTFKVQVFIENCTITNMKESIFRTDSKTSTVSMINTRYSGIGKQLFMGVSPGNITQRGNSGS
jgi:hypothetical protein